MYIVVVYKIAAFYHQRASEVENEITIMVVLVVGSLPTGQVAVVVQTSRCLPAPLYKED